MNVTNTFFPTYRNPLKHRFTIFTRSKMVISLGDVHTSIYYIVWVAIEGCILLWCESLLKNCFVSGGRYSSNLSCLHTKWHNIICLHNIVILTMFSIIFPALDNVEIVNMFGKHKKNFVLSKCHILIHMTNGVKLSYCWGNTKTSYNKFKQYRWFEIITYNSKPRHFFSQKLLK